MEPRYGRLGDFDRGSLTPEVRTGQFNNSLGFIGGPESHDF